MIITILYVVSCLDALSFAMLISIITPYMISLGASQLYMGALGSLSALISLIWNPFVGSLSDTYGRKKVLLHLLIICFVANLINAIWTTLIVLLISRILAALGTQILTLLKALIDDNIESKEAKMSAINRTQALGGVAFILGSLISGQLSDWSNGFQLIFLLISAMFLINFGLVSLIGDKQIKRIVKIQPTSPLTSIIGNLLKIEWSKFWDLLVIKLVIDFVLNVFQFSWMLILSNRFELSPKHSSYVFASIISISILTTLAMIRVKSVFYKGDESGFARLSHGIFFLILSFLGLGLAPTFRLYVVFLMPMSIGRTLCETTMTEVLLARASPQEKGGIMGTFDNTIALGGLIAPILSGLVSKTWGDNTPILLCTIPLILGGALTLNQKRKTKLA